MTKRPFFYRQAASSRGTCFFTKCTGLSKIALNLLDDTESEQSALGRVGQPTDIADVVAFLSSSVGRRVTGQMVDATVDPFLNTILYSQDHKQRSEHPKAKKAATRDQVLTLVQPILHETIRSLILI